MTNGRDLIADPKPYPRDRGTTIGGRSGYSGTRLAEWQTIETDLSAHAGREVTVRLFKNLPLNRLRLPSLAH